MNTRKLAAPMLIVAGALALARIWRIFLYQNDHPGNRPTGTLHLSLSEKQYVNVPLGRELR